MGLSANLNFGSAIWISSFRVVYPTPILPAWCNSDEGLFISVLVVNLCLPKPYPGLILSFAVSGLIETIPGVLTDVAFFRKFPILENFGISRLTISFLRVLEMIGSISLPAVLS